MKDNIRYAIQQNENYWYLDTTYENAKNELDNLLNGIEVEYGFSVYNIPLIRSDLVLSIDGDLVCLHIEIEEG